MALAAKKASNPAPQKDTSSDDAIETPELASVHPMTSAKQPLPLTTPSDSDWLEHPLTSAAYPIQTPMVQRLFSDARMAVKNNISGCYFKAYSGDGVTETLRSLREMLEESFDRIAVVCCALNPNSTVNERRVVLNFQLALTNSYIPSKAVEDTEARLIVRFEELARKVRSKVIVILLDGLQYISEEDVSFISKLRAVLHDSEPPVAVVTFGGGHDPAMDRIAEKIKESALSPEVWSQVVGFQVPFTGIRSMDDIRDIFDAIDQEEHGGISWPCFFLPIVMGRTFTLAGEVKNFKAAFDDLTKKKSSSLLSVGIPSRALFKTVSMFFEFASGIDPEDLTDEVRTRCWREALQWIRLIDVVHDKASAGVINGGMPNTPAGVAS
ncbi:hypothetical protein [Paraburkholderia sp. GAS42]|uniref:hypothetical protein n=1 Tax=Paraburkholderia sp. GAS42 TaxID=3035135 RepID=UPI003D1AF783